MVDLGPKGNLTVVVPANHPGVRFASLKRGSKIPSRSHFARKLSRVGAMPRSAFTTEAAQRPNSRNLGVRALLLWPPGAKKNP